MLHANMHIIANLQSTLYHQRQEGWPLYHCVRGESNRIVNSIRNNARALVPPTCQGRIHAHLRLL